MLTITCDAQESVLYAFDLFMHDLPNSPPLRASVGDSALGGLRFRRAEGPLGLRMGSLLGWLCMLLVGGVFFVGEQTCVS